MSASFFRCALSEEATAQIGGVLQPLLLDLLDMALQTKHAHWNVRGALFVPLHEQLDKLHASFAEASDELAERLVTLGVPANGLSHAIARDSRLTPLRANFLSSQEVVEELSNRLLSMVEFLRKGIEATGVVDPVTQDLLIGITAELEKHLWMLQVQQL